jgi:fructokinase
MLRDHLADSGVHPSYFVDTDDLTTLAAVHLREGQATYSFHAQDAADRGMLPEHLMPLPPGAALHLGSIALVLEPVASTLEWLLRREAGGGSSAWIRTFGRGLISDRVSYIDRFEGWMRLVDILKVSREDLAWLYPRLSEDGAMSLWHTAGIPLVVVNARRAWGRCQYAAGVGDCRSSEGAGCRYRRRRRRVHVRCPCSPS